MVNLFHVSEGSTGMIHGDNLSDDASGGVNMKIGLACLITAACSSLNANLLHQKGNAQVMNSASDYLRGFIIHLTTPLVS